MNRFRKPGCLAAATAGALLGLYVTMVAGTASTLFQAEDGLSKALGALVILLPTLGVVWMIRGWMLGSSVLKMADILDSEGRVPIPDGSRTEDGRLTTEAAEAVFEVAQREVEANPDDWRAWFQVAYAYEATGDRRMARRALRHAGRLCRTTARE